MRLPNIAICSNIENTLYTVITPPTYISGYKMSQINQQVCASHAEIRVFMFTVYKVFLKC